MTPFTTAELDDLRIRCRKQWKINYWEIEKLLDTIRELQANPRLAVFEDGVAGQPAVGQVCGTCGADQLCKCTRTNCPNQPASSPPAPVPPSVPARSQPYPWNTRSP